MFRQQQLSVTPGQNNVLKVANFHISLRVVLVLDDPDSLKFKSTKASYLLFFSCQHMLRHVDPHNPLS